MPCVLAARRARRVASPSGGEGRDGVGMDLPSRPARRSHEDATRRGNRHAGQPSSPRPLVPKSYGVLFVESLWVVLCDVCPDDDPLPCFVFTTLPVMASIQTCSVPLPFGCLRLIS